MFIRIVRHWCHEGGLEEGRAHIDSVGQGTAEAAGFLYRYRLEQPDQPQVLTTLTAWQDEAAFGAFQASRRAGQHSAPPFARVEHEAYHVRSVIGQLDPARS